GSCCSSQHCFRPYSSCSDRAVAILSLIVQFLSHVPLLARSRPLFSRYSTPVEHLNITPVFRFSHFADSQIPWHWLRHELTRLGQARRHYPQPIRSITPSRFPWSSTRLGQTGG